ncbi:MAG: hypothetical protein ACMUIG_06625 [Thermoplasmatota archaeon]
MGILVMIGSIVGAVVLGVIAISMIFGDSGADDPIGELCWLFILILVIIGLILCMALIIISTGFSILLAGQVIGGYNTYKGKHFAMSLIFSLLGTATSTVVGLVCFIIGIANIQESGFIALLILGSTEIILLPISSAAIVMMIISRSSFSRGTGK